MPCTRKYVEIKESPKNGQIRYGIFWHPRSGNRRHIYFQSREEAENAADQKEAELEDDKKKQDRENISKILVCLEGNTMLRLDYELQSMPKDADIPAILSDLMNNIRALAKEPFWIKRVPTSSFSEYPLMDDERTTGLLQSILFDGCSSNMHKKLLELGFVDEVRCVSHLITDEFPQRIPFLRKPELPRKCPEWWLQRSERDEWLAARFLAILVAVGISLGRVKGLGDFSSLRNNIHPLCAIHSLCLDKVSENFSNCSCIDEAITVWRTFLENRFLRRELLCDVRTEARLTVAAYASARKAALPHGGTRFSGRAHYTIRTVLEQCEARTMADIAMFSPTQLWETPGFGSKTASAVVDKLAQAGVVLRMTPLPEELWPGIWEEHKAWTGKTTEEYVAAETAEWLKNQYWTLAEIWVDSVSCREVDGDIRYWDNDAGEALRKLYGLNSSNIQSPFAKHLLRQIEEHETAQITSHSL